MRSFGVRTAVALSAILGVSLLVGAGAASANVGDIIERRVPGPLAGGLNRITTGPDGNIWFTDSGNNQIGRMTPAGAFTGFNLPNADSFPIDITTGPDGALWFTEFEGRIGRITTSGQITEFQVLPLAAPATTPRRPLGIAAGPDGALWFVTDCCDPANPGRIGRITTAGVITLFQTAPGSTPAPGITAGPDGNIWYTATVGADRSEGHIQRMSPAGVVNGDFRIPTAYSDPSRLVTGPDGNLWFTEQGAVGANGARQPTFPAPGKIGRITPSGRIDEFTTPGQSYPDFVSNPAGIAVGPDGNLWFTEYSFLTSDTSRQHGGNKIGRITTSGEITEFPIPTQFARADGITGGPPGDGGVYFTESPENFGFGAVGRIQALPLAAAGAPAAPPAPPVPPGAGGKFTAKMSIARATINRSERVLDVLAPMTSRASGHVRVELHAAGRRFRFRAPIDSADARIRFRKRIPAAQARLGTGIITITYAGDSDTRPQTVRLRAASRKANLRLARPRIVDGRIQASGTVNPLARGVVRLQLEYDRGGNTSILRLRATIGDNGRWRLNEQLSETARLGIAQRAGTVHSYTLFTGYEQRRIRGEMRSFQVLGER